MYYREFSFNGVGWYDTNTAVETTSTSRYAAHCPCVSSPVPTHPSSYSSPPHGNRSMASSNGVSCDSLKALQFTHDTPRRTLDGSKTVARSRGITFREPLLSGMLRRDGGRSRGRRSYWRCEIDWIRICILFVIDGGIRIIIHIQVITKCRFVKGSSNAPCIRCQSRRRSTPQTGEIGIKGETLER